MRPQINHQDAILELIELYKDNTDIMEIKLGQDDGGNTIDIVVNTDTFKEDIFSRRYKGIPVCVLRKPNIVVEKIKYDTF